VVARIDALDLVPALRVLVFNPVATLSVGVDVTPESNGGLLCPFRVVVARDGAETLCGRCLHCGRFRAEPTGPTESVQVGVTR
jgi:hypothetical protein